MRLSFGGGERLHIATFAIVRLASRPALIQFLTLDSLTEKPGTGRGRVSRPTRPWAAASFGSGRCAACGRPPAPRALSAPHRRSIAISASFCYNFRVPRRMSFLLLVFLYNSIIAETRPLWDFFLPLRTVGLHFGESRNTSYALRSLSWLVFLFHLR